MLKVIDTQHFTSHPSPNLGTGEQRVLGMVDDIGFTSDNNWYVATDIVKVIEYQCVQIKCQNYQYYRHSASSKPLIL